jgi:hypothetical protein
METPKISDAKPALISASSPSLSLSSSSSQPKTSLSLVAAPSNHHEREIKQREKKTKPKNQNKTQTPELKTLNEKFWSAKAAEQPHAIKDIVKVEPDERRGGEEEEKGSKKMQRGISEDRYLLLLTFFGVSLVSFILKAGIICFVSGLLLRYTALMKRPLDMDVVITIAGLWETFSVCSQYNRIMNKK